MVLGGAKARTPAGHPILIDSPVFDDTELNPVTAIALAARKRHGIEAYLPDWELISAYTVKDDATVTQSSKGEAKGKTARVPFDVARVYRYLPETSMRRQLGISEDELDHLAIFKPWWAVKQG
jgi:hypothetical protein